MSVSVNGPKTPVTKGSTGIAVATLPNICKMPGPPAPFVPTPLPNIGKSGDSPKGYSKKVKIENNAVGIKGASFKSVGDVASKGTGGGLISNNTHGACKFISPGSMDVKFEGKNVHLLTDMITNNGGPSGSPPNAATMMGIVQNTGHVIYIPKSACPICDEDDHGDLEESNDTKSDATALLKAYETYKGPKGKKTPFWKGTMIGVVNCGTCNSMFIGKTKKDHNFAYVAEDKGHHFVHMPDKLDTVISMLGLMKENTRKFENALAKANMKMAKAESENVSRNPSGACAAQKALVLAALHSCIPAAMTEKWFSPGRPKRENVVAKPSAPMGRPVRHMNESGDLVNERHFEHGESVPPCETCNLLLPFLTCRKEIDGPCTLPTDDCTGCK